MIFVMTRMGAIKLAWHLFHMATGSKRVGLRIMNENKIELLGDKRIDIHMRGN